MNKTKTTTNLADFDFEEINDYSPILAAHPYKTPEQIINELNKTIAPALELYKPPEKLTLSEWADKYRFLSSESSAEPGLWRTSRTPYLKRIMDCFTDPKVRSIVMASSSQVGKSELELNAIGYIVDNAPSTILYVHPNLDAARDFSRERLTPMFRDSKRLKEKVRALKSRDGANTVLRKTFPGGTLKIIGSESPAALAGTPARYVIGDEMDRWALSAGREGDPWELLKARQKTFYNAKSIEVSTPTIKGQSRIEYSYLLGTQERWCHKCPQCGEYFNIVWDTIRFTPTAYKINNKKFYEVSDIGCACPHCGCISTEEVMKNQPAKWIAENPDAYEEGRVSFWLNAFSSPWAKWIDIIKKFLEAKDDPQRLQVVFNTQLGELWEDRGDLMEEDEMLARREYYDAELPDGCLVLTCGVDTQDDRLEYEVVGYGFNGESWGIQKGYILGDPAESTTWRGLDEVIDRRYKFKDGQGLKIGLTFVDSGGHKTQSVYEQCKIRQAKRVFAIKGKGGEGYPYITAKPSRVAINGNPRNMAWLYIIGVDEGKSTIMSRLKVQEAGANYCHFPRDEVRGYDESYFNGLLSERLVLRTSKTGKKFVWEKIPGHTRNEALDCRNYANAAFKLWSPDLDKINQFLKTPKTENVQAVRPQRRRAQQARPSTTEW
ncbi:MAG: phage terminase large subunit family protein [Clostridia bacterium]|nr:phage terminase large subunit family protein [Clostridia bacterium]